MTKSKKKRSKQYTGWDAATKTQPSVQRITAVDRGQFGQWYYERRRTLKIICIVLLILAFIVWMLSAVARIV